MFRTALTANVPRRSLGAARSLHATPAAYKSMTETVKETASNINLKVGQTLASGIEKGEEATEATKEKTSDLAGTAKVKADETSEVAKHKANQASAGAKEAKQDFKKEVKK